MEYPMIDTQRQRRSLLAVLCACLFLTAILGMGATQARAEELPKESESADFNIQGSPVESNESLAGEQEGNSRLLVSGRNLEVNCKKADVKNGTLSKAGDAHVGITYLECRAYSISPPTELPCFIIPNNEISAEALLLAKLHGATTTKGFVLAEPNTGSESFGKIKFEEGTECPLPLTNEIKGTVSGEMPAEASTTQLVTFSEAIQNLMGTKLLFGVNQAIIDGSATLSLSGTHKGSTWGVPEKLPNANRLSHFTVLDLGSLTSGATFTGKQEEVGTLFLVPGRNFEIKCTAGDLLEGVFSSETDANIKIEYLGCGVFIHNTGEELPCVIKNKKSVVLSALLLPVLHGPVGKVKPFIIAEGKGGAALTVLSFESGTGCTLPLTNEIKGTFGAELKSPKGVSQLLILSEGIQKLLGASVKYGTFEAFSNSSLILELSGKHLGCEFGVA